MNHNPFYSINTNLYDESFRSSAPTTLNGESVILSQEQQRRVCDTLNTSIVGCATNNQPMLCAQKQFFPGGVLFTFPTSPNTAREQCCRCAMYQPQSSPQAAVQSFFPSSVEYLQMNPCGFQQPPRENFKLQFHRNSSTSSSDLLPQFPQVPAPTFSPPSPKSCQQCQTMQELMFPSPPIDFPSTVNKLVLSKCPGPPTSHVVDVLDEQKKVSFSDTKQPNTKEESIQMTSECICDVKKCKAKPKKSKRKARSQKQTSRDSSSSGSESNSENREESRKVKKKRWRKRKKKSDSEGQSSDERQRSQKRLPTKSKHNLKTESPNELGSCLSSEELSLLLSSQSSKTSTGSEECYCP